MNREQAKELLPIIKAFAKGKTVQSLRINGNWVDLGIRDTLSLITLEENPQKYRIKPEPKYHPFKNAEECWQEMQKHEPFGWVKWNDVRYNIYAVSSTSVCLINGNCENMDFAYAHQKLIFADGTPFGIKEE